MFVFCVLCFVFCVWCQKRELFLLLDFVGVKKETHTHTHTHTERERDKNKETKNSREREREKKTFFFKTRDTFMHTHTRRANDGFWWWSFFDAMTMGAYDEDEIDRLARANFERRIGAIVVEHRQRTRGMMMQVSSSLLGHATTAEKKKKKKKKKKKTTKEEEEEEDVRETSRKEMAKGLEPSRTTTTTKEEEEEEEEDANEKARKEVAKGLEQSAKAFKHASEIILMAGGEGAKARRWATTKDTSTSSPLRVDVDDDDDAEEEKENTKTTREERRAVERKMEEIAKRVYVENETKTRARERLAVVDTILEVLKDTGDDGKGGGDA